MRNDLAEQDNVENEAMLGLQKLIADVGSREMTKATQIEIEEFETLVLTDIVRFTAIVKLYTAIFKIRHVS